MIKSIWITCLLLMLSYTANAQVYPVYFADVIKEKNKDILHFEWRPDFQNYDKAFISNSSGKVLGKLYYPDNHFRIKKSKRAQELFITAVANNGEKSVPVKVDFYKDYSGLYASGPVEQVVVKKEKGKNARFVGAQSGREFIAKGVNFCGIRLADHDSFEPEILATKAHIKRVKRINSNPAKAQIHEVKLGEEIQCYDEYRTETLMRILKEKGFNLVRVFVKTGERGSRQTQIRGMSGPEGTKGIYAPYMDNFIHFLTTAQKYGIYVMPCFTENEMLDNAYFRKLAKGATKQAILFSKEGIEAKQHYVELFLQYIKKKDPALLNSIFALTMQNEFAWHSDEAPFNQTSGSYIFLDGTTYDMSNDDQRRALANAALNNYYTKMKQTVTANAPGMPIGEGTFAMGAVGKTLETSKGIRTIEGNKDVRFPMTAVEYLQTDIDFLDFHIYRWRHPGTGAEVFNHFADNMQLFTPEAKELMKGKPIIMGEFGSFKENEATLDEAKLFVKQLNDAALEFGFKGSLYWTIDTFVQTRLWNLMWEDAKMLEAFGTSNHKIK